MRRMSVLMIVVGLIFVFVGCGKISPTGPSEAVASEVAKSATGTGATATASIPVLSLSPSQTTISVGDEVTVEAVVENVVDLWGVAATVMFDNNHLQFTGAEEGMLLKVQNTTSFMHAIAAWGPNQLAVGLVSLGKVPGVTGYGTLFRMTFRAISSGQSELKFIETALRDSTNSDMKFESRSTTITIR